jgi:hypothetical protein
MPARVELIWASIADSEFYAVATWAWAAAICRCASACVHIRLRVGHMMLRGSDLG